MNSDLRKSLSKCLGTEVSSDGAGALLRKQTAAALTIDVKNVFLRFLTFFIFPTFSKIKNVENVRSVQAIVSFSFFHAEHF